MKKKTTELRLKFATSLMFIVMIILIKIALSRMIADSFRQSLFENFTKNYSSTVEFCALFSLFNIYVFIMTFAYSPAKDSLGKITKIIRSLFQFNLKLT